MQQPERWNDLVYCERDCVTKMKSSYQPFFEWTLVIANFRFSFKKFHKLYTELIRESVLPEIYCWVNDNFINASCKIKITNLMVQIIGPFTKVYNLDLNVIKCDI